MRYVLIIILLSLMTATAGAAVGQADQPFGLGVIVGEPTGISGKYWFDTRQAIDFAAAWSFSANNSFQFHTDYLRHYPEMIKTPDRWRGKFNAYFGVGGRIKLKEDNNGSGRNNDDDLLGVRVPGGVTFVFDKVPVELFVEIAPVLDLVPDTDLDVNGATGARFYFH